MTLPKRLDILINDVGSGAIIRHQTEDYNAVIVEYLPRQSKFLAVKLVWDGEGKLKKKHYKKFLIEDDKEWMVLTLGSDYILGEGE